MRKFFSILCSLYLILFLADAGMSLVDDSFRLALNMAPLALPRGLTSLLLFLSWPVMYGLMGLTPLIPKRWFVPVMLFMPLSLAAALLPAIYFYDQNRMISWVVSAIEAALALWALRQVVGRIAWRWPLVREEQLGARIFRWQNTLGFAAANLFVLLPLLLAYAAICAALATDHFSAGFVALRPGGLTMRAKRYVRSDGKTVELMPMIHMADADFYKQVWKTFPASAAILEEGVTDQQHLLQTHLSYQHVATSLGLADQKETFSVPDKRARYADVDMDQFSPPTISFLNLVAQLYAGNLTVPMLLPLLQQSSDPQFADQLWQDILFKRNAHLTREIQTELGRSDYVVVPWGALHLPGIAAELEKAGFHLDQTQEFQAVHFNTIWRGLTTPQAARVADRQAADYVATAKTKYDQDDYAGAIANSTKALDLDPKNALAYAYRGMARDDLRDFDGAIADYTKALALEPADATHLHLRAVAEKHKKDVAAAMADFDRHIALEPADPDGYEWRGAMKKLQGNYDGALADYAKAIELDPKNQLAYGERGSAKDEHGDYAGAIADYTKAIELDPSKAGAVYLYRAVARQIQGDWEGALADYDQGMKLEPNTWMWTRRQLLLAQQGRAAADFDSAGMTWDDGWTKTLGLYVDGKIDEAALLLAVEEKETTPVADRQCSAFYAIGMRRLSRGDLAGAKDFFQKAMATGVSADDDYHLARAELARLNAQP